MDLADFIKAAVKVLGPVMLGLGTIFQPKAHIDDHWSVSPRISIQVEAPADESGDPPRTGAMIESAAFAVA